MATKQFRFVLPLVAGCALLASGGCKVSLSTGPMGLEPVVLNPEEWNGTWTVPSSGGHAVARVRDANQGIIEVGAIQSNEQGLSFKTLTFYLRKGGNWEFLSFEAEDKPGQFVWFRVKRNGNMLIMWPPHWDRIAKLIKENKLPGTIVSENVLRLDELKAEHYALLTAEKEGVMVDWENPSFLLFNPQAP